MGGSEDDRCLPIVSMATGLPCPDQTERGISVIIAQFQKQFGGLRLLAHCWTLTSAGPSWWQWWHWSWWRQVEFEHGAVCLVADHHARNLRPLFIPHHACCVPGYRRRQVGATARHEAAHGTLLAPVRDGLEENDQNTSEPIQVHKRLSVKSAHLVLHLVLTLVQVLVLETPFVLHVNVDIKFSRLSLSQLKQTTRVQI